MLSEVLVRELFQVLVVFVRIGTALMIVPGFGERYVLARQRLILAFLLSGLLAPSAAGSIAAPPEEPGHLMTLLGGELAVGFFLGAVTRLAMAALHVAGTIVAFQSGLSAAALFDPNESTQGTLPGNLFSTTALVVLFAGDLHHLLLQALAASYTRLPIAGGLPTGDALQLLTSLGDASIRTGLELAAPLVLTSLLANVALGIMGRLVPSLQLLTIAMPLQLLLAMALLLLTVGAVVGGFGTFLRSSLAFLGG